MSPLPRLSEATAAAIQAHVLAAGPAAAVRRLIPAASLLPAIGPQGLRTLLDRWSDAALSDADAEWLAEAAEADDGNLQTAMAVANTLAQAGRHARAAKLLAGRELAAAGEAVRIKAAALLHAGGRQAEAAALLQVLVDGICGDEAPARQALKAKLAYQLALARLYQAASLFLAQGQAPAGDAVAGFVVVYNVSNPVLTGLMAPLGHALQRAGYAVAAVTTGTLATRPTGEPAFDSLQGCLNPMGVAFTGSASSGPLSHDWEIDWPAGRVETGGINYFDSLHERIAQKRKRHTVDIATDPKAAELFQLLLRQSDAALVLCHRLIPLARLGKPVRIAGMDAHFAPTGVIRKWCDEVGRHHGIHLVSMSMGYENYYSNLGTAEAGTLAVEDLTARPDVRAPFIGGATRFDRYLAGAPEPDADSDAAVRAWIAQNRSLSEAGSASASWVLAAVEATRARGGKVFAVFGKVSIDFAAPGDRGFAHPTFKAWIADLAETVAGSPNLLLIKPHPHELRPEIVTTGVEMLRDMVPAALPENVVFMDHGAFSSHELAPLIDAAFLWNGTAALELSVLGVPVFPASIWAVRDYPVGLPVLADAEAYRSVLHDGETPAPPADLARRAAAYLRFMRSDHVAIPFRYVRRAATNQSVGPTVLYPEDLERLARDGDPYVERAAERFFEFA